MNKEKVLLDCWNKLYPNTSTDKLEGFIKELSNIKLEVKFKSHENEWYKDAIVYSLYVDLFNKNFQGIEEKLDYLSDLGVNCLWLLPILDSPMRDAGFDISDYRKIRPEILGTSASSSDEEKKEVFVKFLESAHKKGIKVIFDIALNHTSDQHFWFKESRKSEDNPFRNYYIWNKNKDLYKETRLLFEGMEPSNWEKDGEWYYFHRFFSFQPDLNYKNPDILLEMSRNILYWLKLGVDGFRADAIPYIWKEDGTTCENLPQNHVIVRFFRAVLDIVRPHTLLLAEACQKPKEVVKYFGDNDECNAGYHFPLMPQMFKSIAMQNKEPILLTLSPEITPEIPKNSQWFTFLRCHDELSLELVYVSEEDRKYIHENYCKNPKWDFRLGQGISARLAELFDRDERKIALAYSIMLTLPGTPVIYYGDEFGKLNDETYYKEMIKMTGKDDTRFLVRGKIDWEKLKINMENPNSFSYKVFDKLSRQIKTRKKYKCFGRGKIEWVNLIDDKEKPINEILSYLRIYKNEKLLIINNLSSEKKVISLEDLININDEKDIMGQKIQFTKNHNQLIINPYAYLWIKITNNLTP
ncbi:MAG: alpha-glucosidase C-terminal domain-containing protein [Bacteroidales bacterium]|nr:alpha-glucosidase C-terminal domain-containing protein [Bacteroidales bacterium]